MKSSIDKYASLIAWVQGDLKKDHTLVNRKVFSVVFWCLVLPSMILLVIYGLRKYQWIEPMRNVDLLVFTPPFFYSLYSLWPTLKEIPRVFKKGGLNAVLDESQKEVEWREKTAAKMSEELSLTPREWALMTFHLRSELERMRTQNRYMSILAAVILLFMFQFLDLGGTGTVMVENGPAGFVKALVDMFAQWSIQVFSLALFSTLFYLSGLQFQRHMVKYLSCVERILIDKKEST